MIPFREWMFPCVPVTQSGSPELSNKSLRVDDNVGCTLALSSSDSCFPDTLSLNQGLRLSYSVFVYFSQFVLTHLHMQPKHLNIGLSNRQPCEDTQH